MDPFSRATPIAGAVLVAALALAPAAAADESHDHGSTPAEPQAPWPTLDPAHQHEPADEHEHGPVPSEAPSEDGAHEEDAHEDSGHEESGHEESGHGDTGHGDTGHGTESEPVDRPRGLVLGGFALVNGTVLLAALRLRRRKAAELERRRAARSAARTTATHGRAAR